MATPETFTPAMVPRAAARGSAADTSGRRGRLGPSQSALIATGAGCVGLAAMLIALGNWGALSSLASAVSSPFALAAAAGEHPAGPTSAMVEATKLIVAAAIGLLITLVQRQTRRDPSRTRSMDHAQILLCVSGAMMMVIIGNSLARAFGIAGAASIIRFRTPVDDARDSTILFLLMALGMATGLGAFAVAGVGTVFLALFLVVLDRTEGPRTRAMMVDVTARGEVFPDEAVRAAFARHGATVECREVIRSEQARVRYAAMLPGAAILDDLTHDLLDAGPGGLRAVSWDPPKKRAE